MDVRSRRCVALEGNPSCTHKVGPYGTLHEWTQAYVGGKLLHAEELAHLHLAHLEAQGKEQAYFPYAYLHPRPLGEPLGEPLPGGVLYGWQV